MANDLNQCNFIGRLGSEVETRHMTSGDSVSNFRIAVNWKSKDKEGAEWVSVTAFGKLSEICSTYLKKGSKVFISGRMKTDEHEGKYYTKIVANNMQMLDSRQQSADSQQQGGYQQQAPQQQGGYQQSAPNNQGFDDDPGW